MKKIGTRFWNKIIKEHAIHNKTASFDESFSTFFKNLDKSGMFVNPRYETCPIYKLKARAILVDMEEGVLNQTSKSPLAELLDPHQYISSQSGSGNNWAVGYNEYGQSHGDLIIESIRKEVERCDALSCFWIIHSLGGGTGSGLGSYLNERLVDEYPEVYRFSSVVCPSENDDVVTSPYNTLLSMGSLIQASDCVLPIENTSLYGIYNKIVLSSATNNLSSINSKLQQASLISQEHKPKAFDTMNNIVANLLINMTSSMRFEGSLNVDMNDIVTNLVPFPKLKFLSSSMTPLYTAPDLKVNPRKLETMFTDAFAKDNQLISTELKSGTFLACALIARGKDLCMSDIRNNIDRLRPSLKFTRWNREGWKTGLCHVPPVGQETSLLTLSNNTCISDTLSAMSVRFKKLYKRKANLHHYLNYIEQDTFQERFQMLNQVIQGYKEQVHH